MLMENNRKEYVIRCVIFTMVMAVAIMGLYLAMAGSGPFTTEWIVIGGASVATLILLQLVSMQFTLRIPDDRAEPISRSHNAKKWAWLATISVVLGMVIGALLTGSIVGDALANLTFACALFGAVSYPVARGVAWIVSLEQYRPWRTQQGYAAYLNRENARRMKRASYATAYIQQHQNSNPSGYTVSTAPEHTSVSASSVRGHIYRVGFNASEVGYFTGDTIYKKDGIWNDTKLGTYRDGRIDDDSRLYSMHTVGRYEWSSTYGGYLIYAGDSRKEFIGRVCRNGDIQAAKQPNGVTEIVLQGVEYTTIGRFTGDPEGAAAAAYLLLFR